MTNSWVGVIHRANLCTAVLPPAQIFDHRESDVLPRLVEPREDDYLFPGPWRLDTPDREYDFLFGFCTRSGNFTGQQNPLSLDYVVYLFRRWYQLFGFNSNWKFGAAAIARLLGRGDGHDWLVRLSDATGQNSCVLVVYRILENILCAGLGFSRWLYWAGHLGNA